MYKDYYSILEISKNSSEKEIRRAYRRLAKQYHPDINKSKDAHEKFIEITEAYEILINQRFQYDYQPSGTTTDEWKKAEYRNEKYEKFREEVREKARQQARMRYEEFQKQNEAFQKSGFNDLILLFKIFTRTVAIFIFLFLFLIPIYVAINNEFMMILLLFITWPFAGIIGWHIYDNRKNYFLPGKFYYTIGEIKKLFIETNATEKNCYYSPDKSANSKPYKIELLKLKEIKLRFGGIRQYTANYINEKSTILIPRSKKAFIVHSLNSLIKIAAIISCMIFLDTSSFLWRIIIGMTLGGIISSIVLLISRTKSNISYIFDYSFLLRVSIWLFFIIELSKFSFHPFNIKTSDSVYFAVAAIIIFDSILMQLISMALGKYATKPIISQYNKVKQKFSEGYKFYNDVPVFSVIYPLFKWVFG